MLLHRLYDFKPLSLWICLYIHNTMMNILSAFAATRGAAVWERPEAIEK